MTKNEIITKLHNTSKVQSRYRLLDPDDTEYIHDELEVTYHPAYDNDEESIPAHFSLAWERDSALLWTREDVCPITELPDGWFTFFDNEYGNIDFKFIEA